MCVYIKQGKGGSLNFDLLKFWIYFKHLSYRRRTKEQVLH